MDNEKHKVIIHDPTEYFPLIGKAVCLHTRLEIMYVVDGYEVEIIAEDESVLRQASGDTIFLALEQLELSLTLSKVVCPRTEH